MKLRPKKWNRGVILGVILLIALTAFIVVKEVQFKQEVPAIRERAIAYVEDNFALAAAKKNDTLFAAPNETEKAAAQEAFDNLIDKYWYQKYEKDHNQWYTLAKMKENYGQTLTSFTASTLQGIDFDPIKYNVTVKSDGPDRAVVTVSIENLVVTVKGYEVLPELLAGCGSSGGYFYYDFKGASPASELSAEIEAMRDDVYQMVCRGYIDLSLIREDGEWKVLDFDGYYYSENSTQLEGGDTQ